MSDKKKNKSLIDKFFWEIPGDVPGQRAQDDPFQSASPAPGTNNQIPYPPISNQSISNQSVEDNSEAADSSHQSATVSAAVSSSVFSSDTSKLETPSPLPTSDTHNSATTSDSFINASMSAVSNAEPVPGVSNSKSFNWLPSSILLLLVIGAGGAGYHYYNDNPDNLAEAATPVLTKQTELNNQQSVTAPAKAMVVKQPKIIEIIVGEKNKTAESKLHVIRHVVVKGDTLWDIAEFYMKNPFRYPELVKLNKIKNPDLIYPDEIVLIKYL